SAPVVPLPPPVLALGQLLDPPQPGAPFAHGEFPARLPGKRAPYRRADLLNTEIVARQLANARQLGCEGALRQQDAAVLHQGAALLALGAADDLAAVDEQVAGGEVAEAQGRVGVYVRRLVRPGRH